MSTPAPKTKRKPINLEGDAAKDAEPKPITGIGVAKIFDPVPDPKWLCKELRIASGGVNLWYGFGYTGKTIFLQYLTLCLVTGIPLFGIFPVTKSRVFHGDYEQGDRVDRDRYQRLARGMGLDFRDLAETDLCLAVDPDVYLDAPDFEGRLRATMKNFEVFLFDSYEAGAPSTDKNKSQARIPLDTVRRACGDDKTPLGIHHAKKPNDNAKGGKPDPRALLRGSGALYDALQGAWAFDKRTDERDKPIIVAHVKERVWGDNQADSGLRYVDVPDPKNPSNRKWGLRVEYVSPEELVETKPATKQDAAFWPRVRQAFDRIRDAQPQGVAAKTLRALLRVGPALAEQCIEELVRTKHIEGREEKRGRARGVFYYVVKTDWTTPIAAVGLGVEEHEPSVDEQTEGPSSGTQPVMQGVVPDDIEAVIDMQLSSDGAEGAELPSQTPMPAPTISTTATPVTPAPMNGVIIEKSADIWDTLNPFGDS